MEKLIALFLSFLLLSNSPGDDSNDQLIFDRISYIYHLKSVVAKDTWPDFADKQFDVPLVYYTETACYVANPTEKFMSSYNPKLVFKNKDLAIYKTGLLDSAAFHMGTGLTVGDSTNDYYYRSPFMHCSSFEITQKTVPGVNSTEQWATMVLHEYFHGFQYKHSSYLDYFQDEGPLLTADSLRNIYKANSWFKQGIDAENDLLLSAINAKNESETKMFLSKFFAMREQRRLQTKEHLNMDIGTAEEMHETMEGTARYVEYSLYRHFATSRSDHTLQQADSSYHSNDYFRDYTIQRDPWLYLTAQTSYFYATGFNMARLLDKLKIEYKHRLFNDGKLTLAAILRQSVL